MSIVLQGLDTGDFIFQGFDFEDVPDTGGVDTLAIILQGYGGFDSIILQGYQDVGGGGVIPVGEFVYGNIPGRITFINRIDIPRTVNIKKPEETAYYDIVCFGDLFKGDKIVSVDAIASTDETIEIDSASINEKQSIYKPYNIKAPIGSVIQLGISGGTVSTEPIEIKILYTTANGQQLEASLYILVGYPQ